MGAGASGLNGGGGSGGRLANTLSGLTQADLLNMPEQQRVSEINRIINDPNIRSQIPSYLDSSDTTTLIYALGMTDKPTVVTDAQLDDMQGTQLFRTVYASGSMPPPTSQQVLDQIKTGDYTQMSGSGGSLYGRAIYFADDFAESVDYGVLRRDARVMRARVNPNAKILPDITLQQQMRNKGISFNGHNVDDNISLYAISQGIDGWVAQNGYHMIINRGALTVSSTTKTTLYGKRRRAVTWYMSNIAQVD